MRYVLMFVGSSEDQDAFEKLPKEQLAAAYERAGRWFEEHSKAGRIVGGAELQGPNTATTVRLKNGKAMVTDGPYIEAKEIVGGFAIVEVKISTRRSPWPRDGRPAPSKCGRWSTTRTTDANEHGH